MKGLRRCVLAGVVALSLACGSSPDEEPGEERTRSTRSRVVVAEQGAATTDQDTAGDSAATGAGDAESFSRVELRVGGVPITVEVADEPSERTRGLMHRDSLPEDHGMLFVYPEERTLSFWMRDTRIPLDIAFIDSRGFIVDIQQMEPRSDEFHRSKRPAMYALEMEKGWFEAHGVQEGDRVEY